MKKKLLPQANSLDTVINVFIYVETVGKAALGDIASYVGFDPRQAAYYLNACHYLDLVDDNGDITDFGKSVASKPELLEQRIYERVITDELIGKIFAHTLLFPKDDIRPFAQDVISMQYGEEYGEAVIKRRASTLISWCREIIKKL